jgi:hypothetical protein
MLKHDPTEKTLSFLVSKIPLLSIATVTVGLIFLSIWLKNADILLRGQYLAFPIIIGSIISIYCSYLITLPDVILRIKFNRLNFYLLFVALYIISINLLLNYNMRSFLYFVLIGLMALLIFIEILVTDNNESPVSVLSKIILLFINIVFGQTLKLPFYFGYTDILPHMHFVETILVNQHVTSQMGDYQYFPLYHIFIVMNKLVQNNDLKSSYFLSTGIAFLPSIIFMYLIAYKVTNEVKKSLTTTLFFSVSTEIIFAGTYMVTRVMSFVIFLLILYLLLPGGVNKQKTRAVAIFLIPPLVFMHQVSLVQEVIILLVFILIELLLYREVKILSWVFPIIFMISFISYWIYVAGPFFEGVIKTIASTSEIVVTPISQNIEPIYKTLFAHLDASIIAFFSIIGIVILLWKGIVEKDKSRLGVLIAIFSFLAMPFFFPGPAAFLTSLLLSYRIPLTVLPFITISVIEGIFLFLHSSKNKLVNNAKISFLFSIFIIYALSTNLILANTTDLNLNKMLPQTNRTYFIESELSSFKFCIDKTSRNNNIYTDYETSRYLSSYAARKSSSSLESIENPLKIKNGYFLIRSNHLAERNQLIFTIGISGFMPKTIAIYKKDFNQKLTTFDIQNKVYENGGALVYQFI